MKIFSEMFPLIAVLLALLGLAHISGRLNNVLLGVATLAIVMFVALCVSALFLFPISS